MDQSDKEERFADWRHPEIQESRPTQYHWIVQHVQNFKLGRLTDIGAFSYINAKFGVTIEDGVQIGSHCSLYTISTIDDKKGPILLKENAKLGSHSVVMPGVTIGKNAVVGAFSFVTADVPDDATAMGVPAKVVTKKQARRRRKAE